LSTGGYPSIGHAVIQICEGKTLVPPGQFEGNSSPRFDPSSQRVLFSAAQVGAGPTIQILPFGATFGVPGGAAPGGSIQIVPGGEATPLPPAPAPSSPAPLSIGLSLFSLLQKNWI